MPLRRVSWACLIGAYVTASTGLISKPGLADNGFSPVLQRIEQLREEVYELTKQISFKKSKSMGDIMRASFHFVKRNYENHEMLRVDN